VKPVAGLVVVVPVHDEEELLGPCLASIEQSLRHPAVRRLPSCIVVTLDACSDRSVEVAARGLRAQDEIVSIGSRNVGAARAAGTARGIDALGIAPARIWLAHTDADTTVPHHWLARQLTMASTVDAVAGVVRVADWSDHDRATRRAFDRSYRGSRLRRHPHVHGANLGLRASAYLDVGGFAPRACSEDHALWALLQASGRPVRSSRRIWVSTSARRIGRAGGGFADTLVRLEAATTSPVDTHTAPVGP